MTDANDQSPPFALYRATSSELASPVVAEAAAIADALPAADDPHGFVLVMRREMSDAALLDRLRHFVDELGRLEDSEAQTVWSPARAAEAPVARISFES